MVLLSTSCSYRTASQLDLIKHSFASHSVEASFRLVCGIRARIRPYFYGFSIAYTDVRKPYLTYGNSALSELTYATHRVVCTYIRTIVYDRSCATAYRVYVNLLTPPPHGCFIAFITRTFTCGARAIKILKWHGNGKFRI